MMSSLARAQHRHQPTRLWSSVAERKEEKAVKAAVKAAEATAAAGALWAATVDTHR